MNTKLGIGLIASGIVLATGAFFTKDDLSQFLGFIGGSLMGGGIFFEFVIKPKFSEDEHRNKEAKELANKYWRD